MYTIVTGPEFQRVATALRVADQRLPAQTTRAMKQAVKPYVDKAKRAVKTMPVTGEKHTGLRRRVARGVKLTSPPTGSFVRIIATMTDPDEAYLPRHMNSPGGWRHPVFGNRSVWVRQRSTRPGWFTDSISDSKEPIRNALEGVLEQTAENVADAGGIRP